LAPFGFCFSIRSSVSTGALRVMLTQSVFWIRSFQHHHLKSTKTQLRITSASTFDLRPYYIPFLYFLSEMANVSSLMVRTIVALVVVAALISTRFSSEVNDYSEFCWHSENSFQLRTSCLDDLGWTLTLQSSSSSSCIVSNSRSRRLLPSVVSRRQEV
jgi:hypothetical protein